MIPMCVTFNSRKIVDSINYDLSHLNLDITDTAILDGQQRLTSLYLFLFGDSYIRPNHARKNSGQRIVTKLLVELNNHKKRVATVREIFGKRPINKIDSLEILRYILKLKSTLISTLI